MATRNRCVAFRLRVPQLRATAANSGYATDTFADDNFAIVFDGLIFNISELARAANVPGDLGVAQIILEGFRKFGDAWFVRLDGSFALLIADLHSGEAIVARDRFAHRPLYFGNSGRQTWVATEAKSILDAPEFRRELNDDNLHSAIGYGFTPGPQTLYKGIFKCVPGFIIRIGTDGKQRASDYFTPTIHPRDGLSMEEAQGIRSSRNRKKREALSGYLPGARGHVVRWSGLGIAGAPGDTRDGW